jgi:hypothetical protein
MIQKHNTTIEPEPRRSSQARLVTFILFSAMWLGCASQNVNPSTARAHTGYVDIFDPEGRPFSWDIQDVRNQRSLYTEYNPQSGIVRLALSPGTYELTINVMNAVITKPATVEVQIADGQVTPVRLRLVEDGTAQIDTKKTPTPGRYTRRTKIIVEGEQSYRLEGDVLPSIPYIPKENVPYALKPKP